MTGRIPENSPRAGIAFALMADYGQGCLDIFGKPFFDLPPELGGQILALVRAFAPQQGRLLGDIRDDLRAKRDSGMF